MNNELIAALGLTASQLQELIVNRAVDQLLNETGFDEDGDDSTRPSDLSSRISKLAKERIDQKVQELAERHLLPNIDAKIDTMVLQETSKWGEAKGAPMTVTEYLVSRAEAYMTEQVSFVGKTKAEDSYNWRANTTRLSYAIDQHLQSHMKAAMESALKDANSTIAKGLNEACRVAIGEAAAKFKIAAVGA